MPFPNYPEFAHYCTEPTHLFATLIRQMILLQIMPYLEGLTMDHALKMMDAIFCQDLLIPEFWRLTALFSCNRCTRINQNLKKQAGDCGFQPWNIHRDAERLYEFKSLARCLYCLAGGKLRDPQRAIRPAEPRDTVFAPDGCEIPVDMIVNHKETWKKDKIYDSPFGKGVVSIRHDRRLETNPTCLFLPIESLQGFNHLPPQAPTLVWVQKDFSKMPQLTEDLVQAGVLRRPLDGPKKVSTHGMQMATIAVVPNISPPKRPRVVTAAAGSQEQLDRDLTTVTHHRGREPLEKPTTVVRSATGVITIQHQKTTTLPVQMPSGIDTVSHTIEKDVAGPQLTGITEDTTGPQLATITKDITGLQLTPTTEDIPLENPIGTIVIVPETETQEAEQIPMPPPPRPTLRGRRRRVPARKPIKIAPKPATIMYPPQIDGPADPSPTLQRKRKPEQNDAESQTKRPKRAQGEKDTSSDDDSDSSGDSSGESSDNISIPDSTPESEYYTSDDFISHTPEELSSSSTDTASEGPSESDSWEWVSDDSVTNVDAQDREV